MGSPTPPNVRYAGVFIAAGLAAGCMGYDEIGALPSERENHKPYIESADPAEGIVYLGVNHSQVFRIVSIDDPDGDAFFGYRWTLNGDKENPVGNGSMYRFTGTRVAVEDLVVEVWDCPGVGDNNDFAGLDECQLAPPDPQSVVQHRWAINVR